MRRPGLRHLPIAVCLAAPLLVAFVGSSARSAARAEAADPDGAALYDAGCTSCHGDDGRGTDDGPSLLDEGPAAVDWVLRTGRMPLPDPDRQAIARDPARYDRAEIDAIIEHLTSLGMEGPAIPDVSPDAGDVARGGDLFRRNCAGCHQVLGQGGVVNAGRAAPPLQSVDATTIGEVLLVGPGVMPDFSEFSDQEVDDLAAYVLGVAQQPDDAGGLGIGHIGPVTEGFVAGLALVGAVLVLRWIGTRTTA